MRWNTIHRLWQCYRFRADYPTTGAGDAVQFWSGESSHCALPGCESAAITLPGGYQYAEVTIDYTYDPLYRLTAADYDNGDYYHYAYDPVGNRLSQESMVSGLSSVSSYQYDIANRLIDVDGVDYTWDANGNLLSDGVNNYAYDSANRLVGFDGPEGTATYGYNGLGDRLTQNGVTYTLDLNSGLTQVLDDGENTYTYGLGRISQQQGATAEYFLGDALGSVRQLSSAVGEVTLSKSYDPYGSVIQSVGPSQTSYGFASEYTDANGLIYLRARYYSTETGRFLTRDTWSGNVKNPSSFNHWGYGYSNPIQYKDPSGLAATHVDCDRINVMLGNMRSLCKVANGDISDPSIKTAVLDAREQFFREIAKLSNFASNYFGDGYWYAAMMLESFLDSNGYVGVYLSSNSSFQSDPGILRATKLKKPQSGDDAKEITPLLHNFLRIVKNDLPRKLYPSKMRDERPKKEQLSYEPTQT